jgi:hypothetical protein
MPWEVLINRLDRYLRLGYVSAVLGGLAIAAEVTVLAMPGSPKHHRDQIAAAATSVSKTKLSPLLVVVVIAVGLIAAYLTGLAARSLIFAVIAPLITAVALVTDDVAKWWRGDPRDPDLITESVGPGRHPEWSRPPARNAFNKARQELRDRWRRKFGLSTGAYRRPPRRWWRLRMVIRTLLRPLVPPSIRIRVVDVWASLDSTYGAEAVNRMLARHPIKLRFADVDVLLGKASARREWELKSAERNILTVAGYCQLWLQKYSPDFAIPPRAVRALLLGTAALPAVVLPRALNEVGGDLDAITSLLTPLRWVLLFGAFVLFVSVVRAKSNYAAATFHQFVMVEMTEEARRGGTAAERSSRASDADIDTSPHSPRGLGQSSPDPREQ